MSSMKLRRYASIRAFRVTNRRLLLRLIEPHTASHGHLADIAESIQQWLVRNPEHPDLDAHSEDGGTPIAPPATMPSGAEPSSSGRGETASARGLDDVLFDYFKRLDPTLSPELIRDLQRLDDMSDETGADLLRAQLMETSAGLWPKALHGQNPRNTALWVLLNHRAAFTEAHDRAYISSATKPRTYRAGGEHEWAFDEQEHLPQLRVRLAKWFASRGRSSHCDVRVYEDGDDIAFVVERGQLVQAIENLGLSAVGGRDPTVTPLRPLRHDVVVYSRSTRHLDVTTQYDPDREEYREAFGAVCLRDDSGFQRVGIYDLQPLVELRDEALRIDPDEDVVSVKLTFLEFNMDLRPGEIPKKPGDRGGSRQTYRAPDVMRRFRAALAFPFDTDTPTEARLSFEFRGEKRRRQVKLIPPDRLEGDKKHHWDAICDWLKKRRFIVTDAWEDEDAAAPEG